MKKLILGCFLITTSSLASALNLDVQRDIFSDVLALQAQQKWDEANQQKSRIDDYPLAYLAEYNYLNAHIAEVGDNELLSFVQKNKEKVISNDLERAYLFYLAEQKKWPEFLIAYPTLPKNRVLQCHYLQASIAVGQSQKVWPEAQKIWLNSTSLPNACDDVYIFYQSNKNLTQADIWLRFNLAYEKNKQGLMRFLMTKMNKKNTALAKQLYDLHKKPNRLLKSNLFPSRDAESFSFLVPTIKRLAKKDLKKAMQAYAKFEDAMPFTFKENIAIKIQFSTLILQRDQQTYFQWLDKQLPTLGNVSLIEQRIRYAIKRDDWKGTAYWLTQLPESKRNATSWLYWEARVLENTGETIEANAIYEKIAQHRNFHGFMAAQKLGLNFPLNENAVEEERGSLRYLNKELSLIEELVFHDLNQQAKQQWRRLLNKHSAYLQQQLGLYAYDQGWAHLSVLASINSKSWDALNIRFPNTKPELFVHEADKYDLEETYIYAITRRESSFDEHAKSPVGASGYMQLMPKTAKETARKIGLKDYKKVEQLNTGKVNVQLGTAYFNGLLNRYDGNRVLATAAYNAGPHRVDKWFSPNKEKGEKGINMDSWVDSIPYRETRAYVQNVMVYNVIYQHILDKPLKFVKPKELSGSY